MTSNHQTLTTPVDSQYLYRLKQGDEDAWMRLLEEWQGPLYQYLCYALPDAGRAQQALSETMDAVIRSIPEYNGDVSLSTFFYSLAAQSVALYYQTRKSNHKRQQRYGLNDMNNGAFNAVLHTMPPRYRQALLLRYHLGFNVTEIASILGQSSQDAELLLAQGCRRLQDAMGNAELQ